MNARAKALIEDRHLLAEVERLERELAGDKGDAIVPILQAILPRLKKQLIFDRRLSPAREPAVDILEWQRAEIERMAASYRRELEGSRGKATVWMIATLPRFVKMLRAHLDHAQFAVLRA